MDLEQPAHRLGAPPPRQTQGGDVSRRAAHPDLSTREPRGGASTSSHLPLQPRIFEIEHPERRDLETLHPRLHEGVAHVVRERQHRVVAQEDRFRFGVESGARSSTSSVAAAWSSSASKVGLAYSE